jgi:hypothetical protein
MDPPLLLRHGRLIEARSMRKDCPSRIDELPLAIKTAGAAPGSRKKVVCRKKAPPMAGLEDALLHKGLVFYAV